MERLESSGFLKRGARNFREEPGLREGPDDVVVEVDSDGLEAILSTFSEECGGKMYRSEKNVVKISYP